MPDPNQTTGDQPPAQQPPAQQPPPPQPPPPQRQVRLPGFVVTISDADTQRAIVFLLMGVVLVVLGIAVLSDADVIRRLTDPGFARGLITFLISVATIGLAFVLVFQSFASGQSDDSFRRAREVFAGLMGVLGTIVGFYFGSAEKPSALVEVAPIRVSDKQLITHITGGTQPYRYSITSTDKDFRQLKKISEDGWIVELFEQPPKAGTTITIEVTDSKEQKASAKYDVAESKPASASPSPSPSVSPSPNPKPT